MNRLVIGGTVPDGGILWSPCYDDNSVMQCKHGYRIYCNLFNVEVFVLTGCPEFNTVDAYVKLGENKDVLQKISVKMLLQYKDICEILGAVDAIKKAAYEEGYRACQSDIRSVIGFNEADYRGSELVELTIPKSRDGRGFNGCVECDSL